MYDGVYLKSEKNNKIVNDSHMNTDERGAILKTLLSDF